jgi:hypothetical protein
MTDNKIIEKDAREPVLDAVDRISEMLFGLFMALTFVGAVSVASAGREEIRTMLTTAIGCNLAWGLVDAVMYLVRTITVRGRTVTLARSVLTATDPDAGRKLIEHALPPGLVSLVSATEVEAMRARLLALPSVAERTHLTRDDLLAAVAIFLIVVASTFPVVLPFVLIGDVGTAKTVSRGIALAMLFFGGLALGRYAGYGSWKAGVIMAGLGTGLVGAIMALGG